MGVGASGGWVLDWVLLMERFDWLLLLEDGVGLENVNGPFRLGWERESIFSVMGLRVKIRSGLGFELSRGMLH